jgi:hypothetical protein
LRIWWQHPHIIVTRAPVVEKRIEFIPISLLVLPELSQLTQNCLFGIAPVSANFRAMLPLRISQGTTPFVKGAKNGFLSLYLIIHPFAIIVKLTYVNLI